MLRYVGKQATIFNIVLLIILIQSVITITQKRKYTNHLNLNSSAKLEVRGQIHHLHCFSLPFHSEEMVLVLKETRGYLNQLLGLERTTFEEITGRVLAEHYRDTNNRVLGN